jgi:hypothetical protein
MRGRTVHQIALPYHWGGKGLVTGDSANELIAQVADPNVSIQESKAFTGNIEPGRRSRGRRVVTSGDLFGPALDQVGRDVTHAAKASSAQAVPGQGEAQEGPQS